MVDRDLLLRKLAEIEQYLRELSEYRHVSAEQYRTDWKTQRIVDRTLQLAIESCVDVATHVIADRRLRIPSSYAEAFQVLGESGLIDDELQETMIAMARFRNVLVHEYGRLDAERVVGILNHRLGGLDRFRAAALRWI